MKLTSIYKSLGDFQRLRILNLLHEGPLCVCHLMEILEAEQVKVSKQLQYMKKLEILESERLAQWRIYRVAGGGSPLIERNIDFLRNDGEVRLQLASDLRMRDKILSRENSRPAEACCG